MTQSGQPKKDLPKKMNFIRLHDQYSLRNTVRAGCIEECWLFLSRLANGAEPDQVRQDLADGKIFGHFAQSTRMALWKIFRTRYLNISSSWIISELVAASNYGPQSPEFISLLYLYFLLRDKLAFDFVTTIIWQKWQKHQLSIAPEDTCHFLDHLSAENASLYRITTSSKQKLCSNTISTLQDFGLIAGKKHRVITRPPVTPQTAFHLIRILLDEGLSGKEIIAARDWHIFLWDQQDVSRMLTRLSLEKCIRYEKSGQTVIVEILENT